ncbi:MAG: DNA repair protein RecN [Pseudomonadales bacterium]|nr:DNA repair protein RecN [Pseudomonadales bacterium]
MLTHLSVNNFALVDNLELAFHQGMTAITGETGAGKSIMLDALGLTLGDRSDTGLIGPHSNQAEIHSSFEIRANQAAISWLEDRDLLTEQKECILRRVITKDGKSRGYINGKPSIINDMKTLGGILIDIHSQHQHQSLLKKPTQRRLLDDYANCHSLSVEVADTFLKYQLSIEQLNQLIDNNQAQTARLQLLTYQAEELQQLAFIEDEDIALETEQKRLANAESILTTCNAISTLCLPNDTSGIIDQLARSLQLLATLETEADQQDTGSISELFSSAKIQLEEGLLDLERFTSQIELNPTRLQTVEERLTIIYDLCRKHQIKPADIPQLYLEVQKELDSLNNIDDEILQLESTIKKLEVSYFSHAAKLTKSRTMAARKLNKLVTKQLKTLGMSGARFEIALTHLDADKPALRGMENIEFLISTNAGQTAKALHKIASGGELSRISLAIQVVAADTSDVPTLIFDEIDVGIGGGIAEVVGTLLRKLGNQAQIVCVTHLPQVAAQGHQHYQVKKSPNKKGAQTEIIILDQQAKVEELARMLGGLEMTAQSLAHAKKMYELAQV